MICAALQRATARASLRAAASAAGLPTGTISATVSAIVDTDVVHTGRLLVIDASLPGAAELARRLAAKAGQPDLLVLTEPSNPRPDWPGLRASQFVVMPNDPDMVGSLVVGRFTKASPTSTTSPRPNAPTTPGPSAGSFSTSAAGLASPAGLSSASPSGPTMASNTTTNGTTTNGATSDNSTYRRRELLAIGCSTGGPKALSVVLRRLPADFPAPIVIVQHMPVGFTRLLAEQLDAECALTVREVEGPTVARRGEVWLAPGDRHVRVINTTGSLVLDDGPEENNCRPAVDVLFRSVAETYGRRAVAVILTGMGDDGRRGAEALAAKGAHIIAQDQATSVVWGMAGAVVRAGVASSVLPLDDIADETLANFRPRQTVPT